MREFKPMVKMETTEPTVELKLKKGGAVEKKMARGGAPMGAMIGAPKGGMMAGAKPKKPSLAARRRAMMASGAAGAPSGRAEAMMAAMPAMKKGGEMESSRVHKAEMKELSGIRKKLTKHEDMPASKGHRGLKTGGSVKKFAEGGRVQHDGGPEQMKQGKKKPAGPVSINQLSGTYKKGGAVMMANGGVTKLGTSIVNKPLADNNTAAQRAQGYKPAADKTVQIAAQKAAAARAAAAQKAAVEREKAARVVADKTPINVGKPPIKPPINVKLPIKPPINVKPPIVRPPPPQPKPIPVRPEIQYTGPSQTPAVQPGRPSGPLPAGGYDEPTLLPKDERAIPMPVPRVESTAYRRGGKVQNNGKNRGGVVC